MSSLDSKIDLVKKAVGIYPNFPKPGIIFRDIFAVLKEPSAFKALNEICLEHAKNITSSVQAVAALESRGFLLGPLLALELQVPFVPIRKKGKLPGKVESLTYDLEYGQDTLEIQIDSLQKGTNVLVVDDLLATGGSMSAACQLLGNAGMNVIECLVIMELKDLNGRSRISSPIHTILEY